MEGSRKKSKNKRRSSKPNPTSSEKKAKYDGHQNPERIPPDLTIDVLKRLPVKTLIKFRCVSKFWSSIISSRDFVNLFLARSSTRPRLLATFPSHHRWRRFFSLTNLQNPTEISSAVANHDLAVPRKTYLSISKSVNGLVLTETESALKICNPATKQFVTLPTPVTRMPTPSDYNLDSYNFFAYDPIDDQYKVLCGMLFMGGKNKRIMEHQIFVLGENAWRRIPSSPDHVTVTDGLCISGTLYYGARTNMHNPILVTFNVKHETFKFVNIPADDEFCFHAYLKLINSGGKLAMVDHNKLWQDNAIKVWVLEDDSKGEWSEKSYVLPCSWRNFLMDGTSLSMVNDVIHSVLTNTSYTDEIIIASRSLLERVSVVCYNMKTNSLRRVAIEGMAPNHEFMCEMGLKLSSHNLTFTEYIESIKLLDGFNQKVR